MILLGLALLAIMSITFFIILIQGIWIIFFKDHQKEKDKILKEYKEWLDDYNAEGYDLSTFAAYYNQNLFPTTEEHEYAIYVRQRQEERPTEFLTITNELPSPYSERYIMKYHANLVNEISRELSERYPT